MFTCSISATVKLVVASCLLATTTLLASPSDPAKPASFNSSLYITKANKIRIAIEKNKVELIQISLRPKGTNQVPVFNRDMGKKKDKLALQLDVSDLPDGAYELEIVSPTSRIVKQVNLATPTVQNEVVRTILLP